MTEQPRKLIIFGGGQIAELAWFYFTQDSDYTPVAFCVDKDYLEEDHFHGLPVVAFETLEDHYPPETVSMFIAISYAKLNALRTEKVKASRDKGYSLASYVSSKATIFPGFKVRDNCFILEDNTIQPFASIGENVTLWSGNHIGHHSSIEDNCFIASHVVVSGNVTIGISCFVGVNATFRDNVTIGARSVIGANALIMKDVEPEGVYMASTSSRSKIPSSRLRGI